MYQIEETETFISWREGLKDSLAQRRILARIVRADNGNFGDWVAESGEVKAMRIHYGPGYRLYYVIRGNTIIFLLCGGDKRTQQADIRRASELAEGV